ncbi:MAG TPA: HAD family hydrolase [Gemmataceae bacterium]|nr:HAD family hydrolase [Gemmataceae bacterium]
MDLAGLVFDLDDTLYLERDYVRSGFAHVARLVEARCGRCQGEIFAFLWDLFSRGERGHTFDRLRESYPDVARHFRVGDLVESYRSHPPAISLLPAAAQLLEACRRRGVRVGLLSDGPLPAQQAKVRALGLDRFLDPIVLTDAWGREFWKPHPRGYQLFSERWGLAPRQLAYVGDNPCKDFLAPRRRGWRSALLRLPGQLHHAVLPPDDEHAAEVELAGWDELRRWGRL